MAWNEPIDLASIAAQIDVHRALPHVDFKDHARKRQIHWGGDLAKRHAIYLDLKFWIGMREADGSSNAGVYGALLEALRRAVSAGWAFCPISDGCFLEVFKQSDPATRRRTVELIDELSLGATLIHFDQRVGTEIAHLLHSGVTPERMVPLDVLVWTKLSNVLGYYTPPVEMFDVSTGRAVEKAFFDFMWNLPLAEMDKFIGDGMASHDTDRHSRLAVELTQGIQANAARIRSFDQAYEHELVGVVDLFTDLAAQVIIDMAPGSLGPRPQRGTAQYKDIERQCLALLVGAMKTERGRATLRTLHIHVSLHAAVRWNKGQKFKANDFFDYQHAAAAVGYCDSFFTERSLASVLTRKDLALDKLYGCHVASTPEAAIEHVLAIQPVRASASK